jgi:hypothetical protein
VGQGCLIILRHTTLGRTLLDEWSDLYLTTHNKHSRPGGIPTHNPSKRPAADPLRSSRGHWERPTYSSTTVLEGNEWSISRLTTLSPRKKSRYHCIGGWVGPIASLDISESRKIAYPFRDSNPKSSSP